MKAVIAVVVLAAVAAGAAFWAYHSPGFLVKAAIEYYGPDVTGVSVNVASVELSPDTGRGRLRNLEIGNPAGFTAARAVRLGDVILEVDPATLRAPLVHVRAIGIEAPAIVYERSDKANNLDAIARNIQSYVKRTGQAEPDTPGRPTMKRRFIIDRLLIRGAKVTMTMPALKGQGVTFELPDIELRDVGRREGGLTASQVAAVVASTLVSRTAQRMLSNIDLLRRGGVDGAIDALKGLVR